MTSPNQPIEGLNTEQLARYLRDTYGALEDGKAKRRKDERNDVTLGGRIGAGVLVAQERGGGWEAWVRRETGMSRRNMFNFMLLARHLDFVETQKCSAALLGKPYSIRTALREIRELSAPKAAKPKQFSEIENPEALARFLNANRQLFKDSLRCAPDLADFTKGLLIMPLTEAAKKQRRREANRQIEPLVGRANRSISLH
jgi:hypothetical protein